MPRPYVRIAGVGRGAVVLELGDRAGLVGLKFRAELDRLVVVEKLACRRYGRIEQTDSRRRRGLVHVSDRDRYRLDDGRSDAVADAHRDVVGVVAAGIGRSLEIRRGPEGQRAGGRIDIECRRINSAGDREDKRIDVRIARRQGRSGRLISGTEKVMGDVKTGGLLVPLFAGANVTSVQ